MYIIRTGIENIMSWKIWSLYVQTAMPKNTIQKKIGSVVGWVTDRERWQSWSIALVLKTRVPQGTVSSNLTPSANLCYINRMKFLYLFLIFAITFLVFTKMPYIESSGWDGLGRLIFFLVCWIGIFIVFGLIKAWRKK